MVPTKLRSRRDAGRALARLVAGLGNHVDVVVLGIPVGGIVLAAEVAAALGAPLDVVLVCAPSGLEGKRVIIVDEGMQSGRTMLRALEAARSRGPRELIAALGVAPFDAARRLRDAADRVVCVAVREQLDCVADGYERLPAMTAKSALALLHRLPGPSSGGETRLAR